jgi:cytoskeleton protein RodZ
MTTTETPSAAPAAATPPPAEAPPSPGALLRAARERAGLGVEDLAGQLKLAKGTLEALERDDFAALSEPVYVRGYYRKIAKVLPIAESELINAYNARTKPSSSAPPMRRLPLARGVAAGTSRNARGPGVGLVVVALIGLVIVIAVATREKPRRLVAPGATPAPTAVAPAPAPQEPAAAVADAPPAAAPATAPAAVPSAPNAAQSAPQAAAPNPPPAATSSAPAAAAGPKQLVLELVEASFVRVDDNQGRTLKIGLVRDGERLVLEGAPPYTVFLGNPAKVKVFLGGQPVDFAAHVNSQNDTARFTVP